MLNKILFAVIVIIILVISFSLGVYVGAFKVPPYMIFNLVFDEITDKEENEVTILSNPDFDISSIIDIEEQKDISEKRKKLINYIFKDDNSFYTELPTKIENNISNEKFSDMQNLASIDRFLIEMEYDVSSVVYLLLPENANKKLVVYHHGHVIDIEIEKPMIQSLLNEGYTVLVISMPLTGENSTPVIDSKEFGKFILNFHDDLVFLESDTFSPLKFFIEPISSSLNYLDQNYSFSNYYMIGISGGGWTTGVYAALDPRIEESFPVAGTAPLFLRINNPNNFGDYEQRHSNFYKIANYLEQYIMASSGDRLQLQIFNKNDPCCFSGDSYLSYEGEIQQVLSKIDSGKFLIHIDENNFEHSISSESQALILKELKN